MFAQFTTSFNSFVISRIIVLTIASSSSISTPCDVMMWENSLQSLQQLDYMKSHEHPETGWTSPFYPSSCSCFQSKVLMRIIRWSNVWAIEWTGMAMTSVTAVYASSRVTCVPNAMVSFKVLAFICVKWSITTKRTDSDHWSHTWSTILVSCAKIEPNVSSWFPVNSIARIQRLIAYSVPWPVNSIRWILDQTQSDIWIQNLSPYRVFSWTVVMLPSNVVSRRWSSWSIMRHQVRSPHSHTATNLLTFQ